MDGDPFAWVDEVASGRARRGLTRTLIATELNRPGRIERSGRLLVNFAANDYLGLAADPRVIAAGYQAAGRYGWGAGASPLVSGWSRPHQELVGDLAAFERCESIALFPTGFAANLGSISALVGPKDAVYGDRLNHSCLIGGARLSGASLRIYPHRDHQKLAVLLQKERGRFRRVLIATDGVFSMDGDLAPLPEIVNLAEQFGAMLLVDEAHGTGVYGDDGRGAASALGVVDRIPIRVGTLSKALGSVGGFVAGPRRVIDHLINHAVPLIYSTAMPPAAAAAAGEALRISVEESWRRDRIHALGSRLREELRNSGLTIPPSEGPIVPVILGEVDRAATISAALREAGFLVPAIRPPTVPRGTARLRISVSAAHDQDDIDALASALIGLGAGRKRERPPSDVGRDRGTHRSSRTVDAPGTVDVSGRRD